MFDSLWQSLITQLTALVPYVSPFWYWTAWGALATFVALVIGWAFPALRSFSGAVILAVVMGLAGYRRGEYDQYRHDQRGRDPRGRS